MKYTHQFIQLDSFAPSFCYYQNNNFDESNYELIKYHQLHEVLSEAEQINKSIIVIYSNKDLPTEYHTLLDRVNHEKIYPFKLIDQFKSGILILNEENLSQVSVLQRDSSRNIILRLSQKKIDNLFEIICSLEGTFSKLTLILLEIDKFSQEEICSYKEQLVKIRKKIVKWLSENKTAEISILTDRLLLRHMNNCDAGIRHFTLAPDGNNYVCPAFYFDKNLSSFGLINSENTNLRLLKIDSSPVCSICDAYHCKRCVYLNKKITEEINIPSQEQCIISHEERNQTKELRADIVSTLKNQTELPVIPEIDYLDPFELLKHKKHDLIRNSNISNDITQELIDLALLTDREILIKVYEQNKNILNFLKNSQH